MPATEAIRFPTAGPTNRNASASVDPLAPPRRCALDAAPSATTRHATIETVFLIAPSSPRKDVLHHEPHVRRTLGEAPHVPREPVLAVRDQHAQRFARLDEPLLQPGLEAVEHRVLVRALRHRSEERRVGKE